MDHVCRRDKDAQYHREMRDNETHQEKRDRQNMDNFSFQCQLRRSKINSIFIKMIFLFEYEIRRTTFINNILNTNHFEGNLSMDSDGLNLL